VDISLVRYADHEGAIVSTDRRWYTSESDIALPPSLLRILPIQLSLPGVTGLLSQKHRIPHFNLSDALSWLFRADMYSLITHVRAACGSNVQFKMQCRLDALTGSDTDLSLLLEQPVRLVSCLFKQELEAIPLYLCSHCTVMYIPRYSLLFTNQTPAATLPPPPITLPRSLLSFYPACLQSGWDNKVSRTSCRFGTATGASATTEVPIPIVHSRLSLGCRRCSRPLGRYE